MKRISLSIGFLLAIGAFSSTVNAQTPHITGVGMANYSTPLTAGNWWSVYGSNLSTGTNAEIYWAYAVQTDPYTIYNLAFYDCCGSGDQSPYWYESYSQINFYAESSNGTLVSQGEIFEWNSYGTASNTIYFNFKL